MNIATSKTSIKSLDKRRFEALVGYTRSPTIVLLVQEIEWIATEDERLLGVVTWDRMDHDFGWVVLGRDERLRFRAVDVNSSLRSADQAKGDLRERMISLAAMPDYEFYQGDVCGPPVDFFTRHI